MPAISQYLMTSASLPAIIAFLRAASISSGVVGSGAAGVASDGAGVGVAAG